MCDFNFFKKQTVLGFSIMAMDFPLLTEVAKSMQLVGAWYYYSSYQLF